MKKLYLKLLLLVSTSFLIMSFTFNSGIDDIIAALKAGNATKLASYFDSRIDISLPAKSDNYSRTQGEMVVRDFFSLNGVKGFQIKHKGENKDGSKYCTGTLQTKTGDYRVTLFMKQKGKTFLLQQLSLQLIE